MAACFGFVRTTSNRTVAERDKVILWEDVALPTPCDIRFTDAHFYINGECLFARPASFCQCLG